MYPLEDVRPAVMSSLEEAGSSLLPWALEPANWVSSGRKERRALSPCQVGDVLVRTSVEVTPRLEVFLRVSFRGPGLSPMQAADHLGAFLQSRLPLVPHSEWRVEIDEGRWIHFLRRYTGTKLLG